MDDSNACDRCSWLVARNVEGAGLHRIAKMGSINARLSIVARKWLNRACEMVYGMNRSQSSQSSPRPGWTGLLILFRRAVVLGSKWAARMAYDRSLTCSGNCGLLPAQQTTTMVGSFVGDVATNDGGFRQTAEA